MPHSNRPIALFVADIDGCLSLPYEPYDMPRLGRLRAYSEESADDPTLPPVTICSGRAFSYVEAMSQLLACRRPVLFEAGGGMFDRVRRERRLNPTFRAEERERVEALRAWLAEVYVPGGERWIDREKMTQAGLVADDAGWIQSVVPEIRAAVAESHPGYFVAHTDISIDIFASHLTKEHGLQWLAEHLDVPVRQMAFVGDTIGDVGALRVAGAGFAVANAAPEASEAADRKTRGTAAAGVLEAYEWCVARNQAHPHGT